MNNHHKTKIKLSGVGHVLCINMDCEDSDCLEYNVIVSGVHLDDAGDDITKKKGKYIISNPITQDCLKYLDAIYDVYYLRRQFEFETEFIIPVSASEFNPKLLQLVKSNYELEAFPYAIMTDRIVYDGVEYQTSSDLIDYGMEDAMNTEFMQDPFNT